VSDAPETGDLEVMKGEPEKAYFILVSTVPPSGRPLARLKQNRPHLLPSRLKNKDWTLK
jgi:hypothetical protein